MSIFFLNKNHAQNLVPNFQFEKSDTAYCAPPTITGIIIDALPWTEYGSADYLNKCDTSNYVGVPFNRFGYQNAYSGRGYVGLIAYDAAFLNREYIQVQLISSLISSQTYYVRFYVSLADTTQYAIESMGALFTDTMYNPYPIGNLPQIENPAGNMLNNKTGWTAVSGSFVASGGEQFITIGNFRDDASTVNQYFGGTLPGTQGAYYFIEDVYVGTTPPPVSVHENEIDAHNIKVYPNPSSGDVTIECNLLADESGVVNIYDITGKALFTYTLSSESKIKIMDEEMEAGVYLYDVIINDRRVHSDKLVVIK